MIENHAFLHIDIKDSLIQETFSMERSSIKSKLGVMGGLIAFFTGLSLLSLFEIVYAMVAFACGRGPKNDEEEMLDESDLNNEAQYFGQEQY